jgi:hypothetical protein
VRGPRLATAGKITSPPCQRGHGRGRHRAAVYNDLHVASEAVASHPDSGQRRLSGSGGDDPGRRPADDDDDDGERGGGHQRLLHNEQAFSTTSRRSASRTSSSRPSGTAIGRWLGDRAGRRSRPNKFALTGRASASAKAPTSAALTSDSIAALIGQVARGGAQLAELGLQGRAATAPSVPGMVRRAARLGRTAVYFPSGRSWDQPKNTRRCAREVPR